jgi:hypothetical protein
VFQVWFMGLVKLDVWLVAYQFVFYSAVSMCFKYLLIKFLESGLWLFVFQNMDMVNLFCCFDLWTCIGCIFICHCMKLNLVIV